MGAFTKTTCTEILALLPTNVEVEVGGKALKVSHINLKELQRSTVFGINHLPKTDSSVGKEPACNAETWVRSLGWEDPLEKGMATHSSILAWRIPWTV